MSSKPMLETMSRPISSFLSRPIFIRRAQAISSSAKARPTSSRHSRREPGARRQAAFGQVVFEVSQAVRDGASGVPNGAGGGGDLVDGVLGAGEVGRGGAFDDLQPAGSDQLQLARAEHAGHHGVGDACGPPLK
ncbi:MAG: hypothetical protein R3C45_13775 [Phycisphaerales bacterium]